MSVQGDFGIIRYEDGIITVNLTPPVAITGWSIVWTCQKRFGNTPDPVAVRSASSGFNGVSGITVTNAGQGVFTIQLPTQAEMSGRDFGNYANSAIRTDSGYRTVLSQGFMQLGAGVG